MSKAIVTLHEQEGIHPLIAKPSRRLWAVAALLCATVATGNPYVLAAAGGVLLLLLLWCGISIRWIVGRMLLLLPFGAGAALFIPFHTEGTAVWTGLGFVATEEGVLKAAVILLKLAVANLLLTYLLAVTPLFTLLRSLRSVGVPAVLLELILLMVRYFFLLKEEAASMLKAQRARGMSFRGWRWGPRTYKRFGELAGVLFLRSYERSKRIYIAMSARGGLEGEKTTNKVRSGKRARGEMRIEERYPKEGKKARAGERSGGGSGETRTEECPRGEGEKVHATGTGEAAVRSSRRDEGELAVEVRGVSFSYGKLKALGGVSFEIPVGSKVALMGPNGAGKSTLISLLNGLELSQAGEVRLFGETVKRDNGERLRRRIGVVYQDPDDQIFSSTVEEDVAFGPRNMGLSEEEAEERVETALASVGMDGMRKRSPFELSYGQKRRVAIAGVLAMRPDLIILDEPMSFLDPKGRDELQALLEKMASAGMTVVVATHDVDFAAEWADRVLLLKDGRLLASGTVELLFDDGLIEQASLHLPRLARPFRLLDEATDAKPRTVKQAAQAIWKLIARSSSGGFAGAVDPEDSVAKSRPGGG
ncbi:cobalt ECF transporter T component CbiQ [Cohnella sp.]|uniref:cobalt ECF transporter T component CbiQ n=1 Tax=Cohnella sp. TaxID=1883426 RepID=UPI0035621032